MPRALAVHRIVIPAPDRPRYLDSIRGRQQHYQRANCNFWLFEEKDLPGAFLEFTEGKDGKSLAEALATAPDGSPHPPRIYQEVEFR